ncbi:hypothetical protein [Streptomyces decoyicus]|uniref:hypothetical protein n=1 Tax=Streptomyces decoyicus TaxID=249567 RepID=UPI0004AB4B31|nr:hypothetical protein [Streptomyces decoyicus]KOG47941.1 hypothetical protein ADK74_09910 [Streptomyces decoyicus]QZY19720.1 hypothetical protein K7C20_34565 [Streptomyces decoyicus]
MAAPPAPGSPSRLRRGYAVTFLLIALFFTTAGPAAAHGGAAGPTAPPALAAASTKPLVFMGLGTIAGLAVVAGAGLIASVRRRRGTAAPPTDRC